MPVTPRHRRRAKSRAACRRLTLARASCDCQCRRPGPPRLRSDRRPVGRDEKASRIQKFRHRTEEHPREERAPDHRGELSADLRGTCGMLHIREQGQVRASTHISGPTTVDASGGQGPQPPRATTSCSLLLKQEVKDARTSATSAGARSVRTRCVRTGVTPPARGIDGSVHRHFHHDGRPHQDDIEEFRTAPPLRERPPLPRMGPVGQRQPARHASRRPAGQDRAPSDAPQLPGGGRTGPAAGCAERTGGRTPRPRSPPWSPGPGTCASPLPWRLGPLPVPCRQVAIPCVLGLLGRAGWPTAGTVSADSSDAPRTTGSCRTGRSEQCGAALSTRNSRT